MIGPKSSEDMGFEPNRVLYTGAGSAGQAMALFTPGVVGRGVLGVLDARVVPAVIPRDEGHEPPLLGREAEDLGRVDEGERVLVVLTRGDEEPDVVEERSHVQEEPVSRAELGIGALGHGLEDPIRGLGRELGVRLDRKSTRLNSSH